MWFCVVIASTENVDFNKRRACTEWCQTAKRWLSEVQANLTQDCVASAETEWIFETNITKENQDVSVKQSMRSSAYRQYLMETIKSRHYNNPSKVEAEFDTEVESQYFYRHIKVFMTNMDFPPLKDPNESETFSNAWAEMSSMYSAGKYCKSSDNCKTLGDLEHIMATSQNYMELLEAWVGWRTVSPPMVPYFEQTVSLGNKAARDYGYHDIGDLWRSKYDMSAIDFQKSVNLVMNQLQPLYSQLHCYVREKLEKHYGMDVFPGNGMIPAHLLGNMWGQEWTNIYPLVEPFPGQFSMDLTKALEEKNYTVHDMVAMGENFFKSLGLGQLPDSFWTKSLFVKPNDREVVCHASAWDMCINKDVRLKACIVVHQDDVRTVHHELGHLYYDIDYSSQPIMLRGGANDGFHEAVGDTIYLSVTPEYLHAIGLIDPIPVTKETTINQQLFVALQKLSFLPFGYLIDAWRWKVYSGESTPEKWNEDWWSLVHKYQGLSSPVPRYKSDFDPGAKFHVASGVPYMRYFLATILQFQFHKALCNISGHIGPLHECSIYQSTAAGQKLREMLKLGQSKPWQEALYTLTGQRDLDAGPMIEFFQPLAKFFVDENHNRQCGWTWDPNQPLIGKAVVTLHNYDKEREKEGPYAFLGIMGFLVLLTVGIVLYLKHRDWKHENMRRYVQSDFQ